MTNAYNLRTHFFLEDHNTAITRSDFEHFFTKTKEKVTFTFGGWDGKSYDGESRTAYVYRTSVPGFEDVRLIKVGKGLHYIEGIYSVLRKEQELHNVKNSNVDKIFRVIANIQNRTKLII